MAPGKNRIDLGFRVVGIKRKVVHQPLQQLDLLLARSWYLHDAVIPEELLQPGRRDATTFVRFCIKTHSKIDERPVVELVPPGCAIPQCPQDSSRAEYLQLPSNLIRTHPGFRLQIVHALKTLIAHHFEHPMHAPICQCGRQPQKPDVRLLNSCHDVSLFASRLGIRMQYYPLGTDLSSARITHMTTTSTPATLNVADFRTSYLTILEELFENVHGFVLDPAESMFETLATVSAADASAEVAAGLAPIVAQVNHVVFLIDAQLHAYEGGDRDWAGSWRVETVTDDEWQTLIGQLHDRYQQIRTFVSTWDQWDGSFLGGAIALISHCAYHLGQIREALGVLRSRT